MLARNSIPHIVHTVDSIIHNRRFPVELLIIEAESDDGTAKYCDWLSENYKNINVIHSPKEGVVKAFNRGMQAVKEGDVLLTHDDVVFPKLYMTDWLWEMIKFKQFDDCGLIIPLNGGGVSGPEFMEGLVWAGTWCMYIPRRTLDEVGIFDEEFHPGNGEDIDLSYRVHKKNWKIYRANFAVDHHRKTEHTNDQSMDVQKVIKRNSIYFKKKYGLEDKNG